MGRHGGHGDNAGAEEAGGLATAADELATGITRDYSPGSLVAGWEAAQRGVRSTAKAVNHVQGSVLSKSASNWGRYERDWRLVGKTLEYRGGGEEVRTNAGVYARRDIVDMVRVADTIETVVLGCVVPCSGRVLFRDRPLV